MVCHKDCAQEVKALAQKASEKNPNPFIILKFNPMSNYLGIDFGTKRMGLAWSDDLNIALPIGAIPGVDSKECMKNLSQEIEQRKIDQIVIGYPIHMDGKKEKELRKWIILLPN